MLHAWHLRCRGWRMLALVFLGVFVVGLGGCATVANPDPRDPFESFNRSMYSFNDVVDRGVVKPVAKVYKGITPSWFRRGVGNFFGNLGDVWSTVNHVLTLRGREARDSLGRVLVNSTIGLGGILDVATELDIEKHPADFGLTLGRWGVGDGAYVVLPLLGSATMREVVAMPLNSKGNLLNYVPDQTTRESLSALQLIDLRAQYLGAGDVVDGAALDKYSFTRDAYLQRKRNILYDGAPPDDAPESESEPSK